MTKYHVLQEVQNEDLDIDAVWIVRAVNIEAGSQKDAIRIYLDGASEGGTFTAIPSSSFKPMTVQVETVTKVKVS